MGGVATRAIARVHYPGGSSNFERLLMRSLAAGAAVSYRARAHTVGSTSMSTSTSSQEDRAKQINNCAPTEYGYSTNVGTRW